MKRRVIKDVLYESVSNGKTYGEWNIGSVILRQMSDSDRLYREAFNCDGEIKLTKLLLINIKGYFIIIRTT